MLKRLKCDNKCCTGCSLCELVCSLVHFRENNPKKAAIAIERRFPEPGEFEVRICSQCGRCKEVCPVGAISEINGVYKIDSRICTDCKICLGECSLNVLFAHPDVAYPIKCDLCGECVSVCVPGALYWE
jgi:Fe-S-cluster-containing hydrogenase component 2